MTGSSEAKEANRKERSGHEGEKLTQRKDAEMKERSLPEAEKLT